MSYHHTNLGKYGTNLPRDLDGYVPEAGDRWQDMRWGHDGFDDQEWASFVEDAEAKTVAAERATALDQATNNEERLEAHGIDLPVPNDRDDVGAWRLLAEDNELELTVDGEAMSFAEAVDAAIEAISAMGIDESWDGWRLGCTVANG